VFDLDRYLERIGLSGRPTLADVHRAHVTSIPFENLDPYQGRGVSLALDDLIRKLVDDRRGGYCFEHNLLLGAALEALGMNVELYLARVRAGAPPGATRPRSHLVLRVTDGAGNWHADAGFGIGTLLEPIPFGPGIAHDQAGWSFRVVQDGDELVLQAARPEGWSDLYGFVPQPVPRIDVEVSNWFTATHPRSIFVTSLIAGTQDASGRLVSLHDRSGGFKLTDQTPERTSITPVALAEVPALLASRFGLPGFGLGDDGRILRTAGG
jgi:N-hydroxyarylamine O-acetyltransferase